MSKKRRSERKLCKSAKFIQAKVEFVDQKEDELDLLVVDEHDSGLGCHLSSDCKFKTGDVLTMDNGVKYTVCWIQLNPAGSFRIGLEKT